MTPINIRTALIVCAVAFAVTAAIGPAVIRYLRKMKFGQKILEIGPKWHMTSRTSRRWAGSCSSSASRPRSLQAAPRSAR